METKKNLLEIAHENFQKWNEALQTKDAKKVAELYAENNSFLPTMSPDFKHGKDEASKYFKHFLEINPGGEVIEEKIQPMGENYYSHNGMYNFEVDQEGKRVTMECRFTFNWAKDKDGKWKILHHHSSVKPK